MIVMKSIYLDTPVIIVFMITSIPWASSMCVIETW